MIRMQPSENPSICSGQMQSQGVENPHLPGAEYPHRLASSNSASLQCSRRFPIMFQKFSAAMLVQVEGSVIQIFHSAPELQFHADSPR